MVLWKSSDPISQTRDNVISTPLFTCVCFCFWTRAACTALNKRKQTSVVSFLCVWRLGSESWEGGEGLVWTADGSLCPIVLFFSRANHRYTTWQNRKWLYFPASCSDWEQGCLLAIPFLPSGSPSSCYCLINVPHFLSLSWLHLGGGRQEVKAHVLDRKFKVRDPWWTSD